MTRIEFKKDTKPEFCIIAPTAYLEQYATRSKTHLVLAHLVDNDPVYADFYLERSKLGDRIIMDNGAFELGESYAPDKLVSLGKRCGAHALVLPDYPFQHPNVTIEASERLIPHVKDAGFSTFFVPQSETGDLEGWIGAYRWAADHKDIDIIGMSILGIPNAIPHIPKAYARVVMAQILVDREIVASKYHHWLGLNSGPNVEIPPLLKMGILNSIDSSGPVWFGINGHEYNSRASDWAIIAKERVPAVDFDLTDDKASSIHAVIDTNVTMTLELFNESKTEDQG